MEDFVITILTSLLTVCFVIYAFFQYHYKFFVRNNIPHLPPTIPYGNVGNPRTSKKPFYITAAEIYSKFKAEGRAYAGMYIATNPTFIPISPDLVKCIMSRDFSSFTERGLYSNEKWDPLSANVFFAGGKKWRNLRTKLSPTFTSGKIKMMFQTLMDCTVPLVAEIKALSNAKQTLNMKELFACYTTDVIGSCAFGIECNSFKNPEAEFTMYGKKIFEYRIILTINRMIYRVFPKLSTTLGLRLLPRDVTKFFTNSVNDVVDYREKTGYTRNDFMQLLIELKRKGEFHGTELAAQCFAFFVAGFETSSSTLTFLLYELSINQEIQNRVREEILISKKNNGTTYETLADLKYTTQVIQEVLRKYPVLPTLTRDCSKDYKVPDSDVVLKKGQTVIISTYGFHMDPEYFPEPEKFDPERFSGVNRKRIVPFTYLPFGEGPRLCLGLRFAMAEMKIALIAILEKFKLRLNSKTPSSLTWNPNSFILKESETIYLDAELID